MQTTSGNHSVFKKSLLVIAYIAVIVIWSTTPITVKWSGEGVSYLFGISLRMGIGASLALVITLILYKKLPMNSAAFKAYAASALALLSVVEVLK